MHSQRGLVGRPNGGRKAAAIRIALGRTLRPVVFAGVATLSWLLAGPIAAPAFPTNTLTVFETSGRQQAGRTVSVSRPFREGEIRGVAQAVIDGKVIPTQCDVKNRWPDGSLKFAVVTFFIRSLPPHGAVVVSLVDRPEDDTAGALTPQQMLASAFDFDGRIEMVGETKEAVSARAMLSAGHWRYWLKGPLVTAVVIEDRSPARSFDKDFGDGSKALHPIFEAWFYPREHAVELGYTVENTWASSNPAKGMRDVRYGVVLRAGQREPRVELVQRPFMHIARSRWHKRFWTGQKPGEIRIDHNTTYLVTTRAIPSYDTDLKIAERLIATKYSDWVQAPKELDGTTRGIGNYLKDLTAGGASDWIGLLTTWDTLYLLTMDERMKQMAFGNSDLAGRIPWHYREADSRAGTGQFFDAPLSGQVETQGRVVSVNARRTVSLWDLGPDSSCGEAYRSDRIAIGPLGDHGWQTTRDHMPDTAYLAYLLTGRYYYLEELQYLAAFIVAHRTGCYGNSRDSAYHRQGHNGFLHDSQVRGDAWGFRTLSYAAFLSPDGTPEQTYFEEKLRNNIALWEGEHNLPLSDATRRTQWAWAMRYSQDSRGPSPLGLWQDRGAGFVESPLARDGRVVTGASGWEEHFLLAALGMARGFGYPTDGLLRFMARLRLNLLLNPAANRYLIEAYRWPATLARTRTWVETYPDFVAQFEAPPAGWSAVGTADHSWGLIALAAVSYLTPYTVDGYSGSAAWALHKKGRPGQDRFATDSPKWAIIPLDQAVK